MLKPSKDRESAPLGADHLIQLARLDFGVFAVLMFPELHDGKQMVPAPYVNLMAEALMAVRDSGEKRLIFNLPPGHMKSLIVSMLFTAWLLGVEPAKRILCISYGEDLTRQLSRQTRRVMTSRLYRRIFPGTVLAKQAEDLLTTTKGGQRLATAVGGAVAGFRAEFVNRHGKNCTPKHTGARHRAQRRRKKSDPGARSHSAGPAKEEGPRRDHDPRLQAPRHDHPVRRDERARRNRDRAQHAASLASGVHPLSQRHRARGSSRQDDPRDPRQLCGPQASRRAPMAGASSALDFPLHPDLGLVAQRR